MVTFMTCGKMWLSELVLVKVVSSTAVWICDIHGDESGEMYFHNNRVTPFDLLMMVRTRMPSCDTVIVAPCYPNAVAARWRNDSHLQVVGDWDGATLVDMVGRTVIVEAA